MGKIKDAFTRSSYFIKILSTIIALCFIIFVPFLYLFFSLSEKLILDVTDKNNQMVLNQIEQNYISNQNSCSQLLYSIYQKPEIMSLLYNGTEGALQSYGVFLELKNGTMSTNPSIHSIIIYNSKLQKTLYCDNTVNTTGGMKFRDYQIGKYIKEHDEIKKMKPILRKIPVSAEDNSAYTYVFTYIMYDFLGSDNEGSYIVLNQDAGWYIDNIYNLERSLTQKISILMLDEKGELCIYDQNNSMTGDEQAVADDFMGNLRNQSKAGYYIYQNSGSKQLVSHVKLPENNGYVLIMQDYNEVFSQMNHLRDSVILIVTMVSIVAIGLSLAASYQLYHPMKKLVGELVGMNFIKRDKGRKDEWRYLQEAYRDINERFQKAQDTVADNINIIKKYHLTSLLSEWNADMISHLQKMETYDWLLDHKTSLFLVEVMLDDTKVLSESNTAKDNENLLFEIQDLLCEEMKKTFFCEILKTEQFSIVFLCGVSESEEAEGNMIEALKKFQYEVKENLSLSLSVIYSQLYYQVSETPEVYKQLQNLMEYRFVMGKQFLIRQDAIQEAGENPSKNISSDLSVRLAQQAEVKNKEFIDSLFEELKKEVSKLNYNYMKLSLIGFLFDFKSELNRRFSDEVCLSSIEVTRLIKVISEAEYLDSIIYELKESTLEVFHMTGEEEESKEDKLVHAAIAYINKNYHLSSLCTKGIADILNVSVRNLSTLFSKATGVSVSTYIGMVQMKEAGRLLCETNLTVSQVALKVGIENESYFYRVFKRYYGCTPREYLLQSKMSSSTE